MGLKALATYELTLKDCRVAADARLGGDKRDQLLAPDERVARRALPRWAWA